jgi:GNAT superfamily N-acetyltransferase
MSDKLEFYSATSDKWDDIEELFGERGACGGCWCMWWRLTNSEFNKMKGKGNREALKKIVKSGKVPGILAYDNKKVVAWCSFAPRETLPRLKRSRILTPVDEKQVWSIICFFIAKSYRKKGLNQKLIEAAINYISEQGGKIIEGYPIDPKKGNIPDVFAYTGITSSFLKAGFKEVARRSETRPIMRYIIE